MWTEKQKTGEKWAFKRMKKISSKKSGGNYLNNPDIGLQTGLSVLAQPDFLTALPFDCDLNQNYTLLYHTRR